MFASIVPIPNTSLIHYLFLYIYLWEAMALLLWWSTPNLNTRQTVQNYTPRSSQRAPKTVESTYVKMTLNKCMPTCTNPFRQCLSGNHQWKAELKLVTTSQIVLLAGHAAILVDGFVIYRKHGCSKSKKHSWRVPYPRYWVPARKKFCKCWAVCLNMNISFLRNVWCQRHFHLPS